MPEALQARRWLILTSSTGSGHDMRAYALREWALTELGSSLEVDVYHALERGSRLGRFGVGLYNHIQRHSPWMHNGYWFVAEAFGWFNARGIGIGRSVWREKLERFRPHLVISMHDSLNRGYLQEARRALGEDRVRCAIYCGEWSGGFGFSRNWIEPAAHRIYVRRPEVGKWLEERGYPVERTRVFCNLLPPKAFATALSEAERRRFRADELGLDPDRFTVFLATGALGADRHVAFLDALRVLAKRIQVIVVSGRNREAAQHIVDWSRRNPELRLAHEGFSDRMHVLMQVSDCLLTRGGANTMAEAVHCRCPVLFHAHHGLMPQERCTLRFLESAGIGVRVGRPRHLVEVLERWLDHPEEYLALRRRLEAVAVDDHPSAFVRELARLADETGQAD